MPENAQPERLIEEPMTVVAEGPAVVILGPGPINIAITPQAALISAERLRQAAAKAAAAAGQPLPVLPIDQAGPRAGGDDPSPA
jgi:hypothetical protein